MEAIGLAFGGTIPDSSFSASSHYDHRYKPSNGRLNGNSRGWAPKTEFDPADYLQIDFLYEYVICAVATQGANGINEWTKNYEIQLSVDGTTMVTYQENNADRVSLYKSHVNIHVGYKKANSILVLEHCHNFLSQEEGGKRSVYLIKA